MKIIILAALLLMAPCLAWAGVVVEDTVVHSGQKVMLEARTMGDFLPRGGVMVSFGVNGTALKNRLSGGDGYARLEYMAEAARINIISASVDGDEAVGHMLVMGVDDSAILVEFSPAIVENPITRKPLAHSKASITAIAARFPVIYLHDSLNSAESVKQWINENGYPVGPVLSTDEAGALMREFSIRAVCGSETLIESLRDDQGDADVFVFSESYFNRESDEKKWQEVQESIITR